MGYEKMFRCKHCGKIYTDQTLREICPKCGGVLMRKNAWHELSPYMGDTETIIAKKTLFGFKVKCSYEEG